MPTFTFTSPEGKTYDVSAPEGATKEQAFQVLQQQLGASDQAQHEQLRQQIEQIPGIPAQPQPAPEPTVGEQAIGAGEAALTLGTGATGGALGMLGGTLKGLAEQILSGQFGTREAAQAVEAAAAKGAAAMTYQPRGEAGREQVGAVGGFLSAIPPVLPAAPAIAPAIASTRAAPVVAGAQRAAQAATAAAKEVLPKITTISREKPGVLAAVGSPETMRRVTIAEELPVPMTGAAGLTKGQATRDFARLQFEKESAKLAEVGAPLRQRAENQTAVILQNFDAMASKAGPLAVERRDIGKAVSQAIVNKANVAKRKINEAYKKADEAGETLAPVEMTTLAPRLEELGRFEGIVPMIGTVRKEAARLGAITTDAEGALQPGTIKLRDSEMLRQFVNDATDWSNRREAMIAKRINESIDATTEGKGGELFKSARKMHKEFADEFENVGLTAKLIETKRGTSERQIAFEDVFDKVVLLSPVDEMNKLRGTLLKSGREGKQAWADMKAAGIEHIKESSLSASGRDAAGQPLLSPDKLNRVVNNLDKDGKLEALYGKKQAQTLRDLAELSSVIYTAPPGAINTSNTASALMVALDGLVGFGATGAPVPVVTSIKALARYSKNRKLKARINEALGGVKGE